MPRKALLAAAVLVALVLTGFAVAHEEPKQVTKVAATFDLDPTDRIRTRACTGADGHVFRIARGVWRGELDFDAPTNVDVRLSFRGKIVVDTTSGDGWLRGHLQFGDRDDRPRGRAFMLAAISGGDDVNGLWNGRVRGGGHLIANVSAELTGGGLTGTLGTGSGANSAVLASGVCRPQEDDD